PAKARAAADDVDDGFQFAVVVGAGLGVGMHDDGPGPEFLRAYLGVRDGFRASHAGSLRRVGVQLTAANDAQTMNLPVRLFDRDRVAHELHLLIRAEGSSHGRRAFIHRGGRNSKSMETS